MSPLYGRLEVEDGEFSRNLFDNIKDADMDKRMKLFPIRTSYEALVYYTKELFVSKRSDKNKLLC